MGHKRFTEQDVLLTLPEAAEFLRVSRATMNRWLASGHLVGYQVGRGWRFYKSDLHAFVVGKERSGARNLPAPCQKWPGSLSLPDLTLDVTTCTVTLHRTGTVIGLTPIEARLLHVLLRNAGHTMRREGLTLTLWGSDNEHVGNQLDGYIARLRNKLEEDASNPKLIQAVQGVGYRFAPIKAPLSKDAETKMHSLS